MKTAYFVFELVWFLALALNAQANILNNKNPLPTIPASSNFPTAESTPSENTNTGSSPAPISTSTISTFSSDKTQAESRNIVVEQPGGNTGTTTTIQPQSTLTPSRNEKNAEGTSTNPSSIENETPDLGSSQSPGTVTLAPSAGTTQSETITAATVSTLVTSPGQPVPADPFPQNPTAASGPSENPTPLPNPPSNGAAQPDGAKPTASTAAPSPGQPAPPDPVPQSPTLDPGPFTNPPPLPNPPSIDEYDQPQNPPTATRPPQSPTSSTSAPPNTDTSEKGLCWYYKVLIVFGVIVALFLLYILFARRRKILSMLGYSEVAENFIRGAEGYTSNSLTPSGRALQAPFSRIIPANDIIPTQSPDSCLGQGKFGVVTKAEYNSQPVAVKTVTRNDIDIEDLQMFLRAAKLAVYVGEHDNLVKLYGADVSRLRRGGVKLVFEYCSQGDLWTYLRRINRITGCDTVEELYEVLQPKVQQKRKTACTSMLLQVLNPLMGHSSDSSSRSSNNPGPSSSSQTQETSFTTKSFRKRTVRFAAAPSFAPSNARTIAIDQLHQWAYQIASGMEYLEQKNVIHGDLAAKNILVSEDLTIKISDFGFSKNLYLATGSNGKKKPCQIPWRWASPETLSRMEFSIKADVWSFGVTVWEMFTLGGIPFLEQSFDGLFQIRLQNGLRPQPPKDMPPDIYCYVLGPCWEMEPEQRPSFERVKAMWEAVVQGKPLATQAV